MSKFLGLGECQVCGHEVKINEAKNNYATYTCSFCRCQLFARGHGDCDAALRDSVHTPEEREKIDIESVDTPLPLVVAKKKKNKKASAGFFGSN